MCCGCRVFQCCCGCTDLKTGVLIWAIIDAVFEIIFVIGSVASVGSTFNYWGIIVFLADIGLAIGAYKSNTGLMLAWLVVMMIQIVVISVLIGVVPIVVRFSIHFFSITKCEIFAGFCSWYGSWYITWRFGRRCCRNTPDYFDNLVLHFCFCIECCLHLLLDCGQFFTQKCH